MTFGGKTYRLATIMPWVAAVLRGYKLKTLLNVLAGWAIVALNFLFVWLTKQAVDGATVMHNRWVIIASCVMLVGVVIAQAVLGVCYRRGKTQLEFRMRRRLQQRTFARVLAARWESVNAYHTGDIVRRTTNDTAEVTHFLTDTFPSILLVLVQLAGAFAFLCAMNARIAAWLAVFALAGAAASRFHFMKMRRFSSKIKQTASMLQGALQECVQHIGILKSLADNSLVRNHISSILDTQEHNVRRRLLYSNVSSTMINLAFAACYLLVFVWGAFSLESGAMSYGALIAFVQLVGQIQGPSRVLIRSISDFAEFYTSCERLNELHALPRDEVRTAVVAGAAPEVVCESVTYAYGDGRSAVLHNFSHTFAAGALTAVVGATGSGKTTLMRLLPAYLRPAGGSISLRAGMTSVPVDEHTRGMFAYVPQDDTLFSISLRDNLLLGCPDATDEQMREALRLACADFVDTLPRGLDTVCGEEGRGLSQGQIQRVCIARALLSRAPVLLLDEATSALDSATEQRIITNLRTVLPSKTIVFITHRDAVTVCADSVVNIENGAVENQWG